MLGAVDVQLIPDFAGGTATLYDAYADVHPWPWLRVRVGKFKPPVGLERRQLDNYVPFVERALDSNLTAQRDVGVQLWGDSRTRRCATSSPSSTETRTAPSTTSTATTTRRCRAACCCARSASMRCPRPPTWGWGSRSAPGPRPARARAPSGTWLSSFKSPAQQTIFSYVSSTSDPGVTVYARGTHTRLNPQLYFYYRSLGLQGEWVRETQPVATGAGPGLVNNQAGHVTLSWTFGADAGYDGPRFARAAEGAREGLGALQVALRASWLDVDDLAFFDAALANPTKSVSAARSGGTRRRLVVEPRLQGLHGLRADPLHGRRQGRATGRRRASASRASRRRSEAPHAAPRHANRTKGDAP